MNRRNFICGLSCFVAGFALCEAKDRINKTEIKNPPQSDYIPAKVDFNYLCISMASHCNLNCIGCQTYSPVSKTEFVTYEDIVRDFTIIKNLYPDKNFDILFIGGEPLLNPEFKKIVRFIHELFPSNEKSLHTNAILLNSMDEEFWQLMKDAKVEFNITKYPINIDRSIYEKKAKDYGIKIIYHVIRSSKFYDLNTHKVINDNYNWEKDAGHYDDAYCWAKCILDLSGSQDYIERRYSCPADYNRTYVRGNLYHCYIHAHLKSMIEYFRLRNIKYLKDDYLKIADVKSVEEIEEFLANPKPMCRFCKQYFNFMYGGKPVQWDFSNQSISEWA